jgi:hypothetical protein
MLEPANAIIKHFNIKSGTYIHAIITSIPTTTTTTTTTNSNTNSSSSPASNRSLQELRGLDILLNEGLNVDEVAAIRSSFRQSIGIYLSIYL